MAAYVPILEKLRQDLHGASEGNEAALVEGSEPDLGCPWPLKGAIRNILKSQEVSLSEHGLRPWAVSVGCGTWCAGALWLEMYGGPPPGPGWGGPEFGGPGPEWGPGPPPMGGFGPGPGDVEYVQEQRPLDL